MLNQRKISYKEMFKEIKIIKKTTNYHIIISIPLFDVYSILCDFDFTITFVNTFFYTTDILYNTSQLLINYKSQHISTYILSMIDLGLFFQKSVIRSFWSHKKRI